MTVRTERFVKSDQVFVGVDAKTKYDALDYLARKGKELGIGTSYEELLQAFLDREELGTTGMVDGLAIPHAKTGAVRSPAVCLAKFKEPVEWEAMDGKPVTVAVALYVPDSQAATTHIKLLSKVAVLASREEFGSFIADCDDPDEIAAYLSDNIHL